MKKNSFGNAHSACYLGEWKPHFFRGHNYEGTTNDGEDDGGDGGGGSDGDDGGHEHSFALRLWIMLIRSH